jgi:hypothetical protein
LKGAAALALPAVSRGSTDVSGPTQQISSDAGLQASVYSDGRYAVTVASPAWVFAGSVGVAPDSINVNSGNDGLGSWQEIALSYGSQSSAIRLYDGRAVALFTNQYAIDSPNANAFPHFTSFPQNLFTFSFGGLWAYSFNSLNNRSPWLFYDSQSNAFLMSPAANFMTAVTQFASDGAMEAAIDSRIGTLPAGFTHRAVLAFGPGINAAFDTWGKTLTGLSGKKLPTNDANALLNQLSYWTDAGAAYYYHPVDPTQYIPVLNQLPAQFEGFSAPIGSLELDSWHYPKGSPPSWTNNSFGLDTFVADPTIFPNGLAAFQQSLGLPLITHTRWIDPSSPLRNKYTVSGFVATDPQYWKDFAAYLSSSGVQVLEQDWLCGPAVSNFNLTDPYAFLDNMATAMQAAGLSIVYCMPLWTHIMQSTKYDNVIAVRSSNDNFMRARWDELLFNARIASAVGLWPFADAFKSVNQRDVLVATLMAGPVGSGDLLGASDEVNLRHAVRTDGVIVKPDAPLTPLDATFQAFTQSSAAPMLASTYTDHAGLRTAYVLAYGRVAGALSQIEFSPESVGVTGPAYVYDFFQNKGTVIQPGAGFSTLVDYNGSYYLVAPIGPSGIAFLGDSGKFVSCGNKRIEQLSDDGALQMSIRFAPGEEFIALRLYATTPPHVSATSGTVGSLQNHGENLYRVVVHPNRNGTATIIFQAPFASLA